MSAETVRIVVPFAPGGPADIAGRLLQKTLTQHIDPKVATFIIENHAGGGTTIGSTLVAKNKKNETVLLLQSQALIINALINPGNFDLRTDLTPVMYLGDSPSVLASSKRSKINTIDDLIKRDKNLALFYGTGGTYTGSHLNAEMLESQLKRKNATMVPYKGQGPAIIALASDEVDLLMLGTVSAIKFKDRINLLAVTGDRRDPAIPNVPTFTEKNLKIPSNFLVIFSNTTADPKLIKLIKQSIIITALDPEEVKKYQDAGVEISTANFAKINNFYNDQITLLEPTVKKLQLNKM